MSGLASGDESPWLPPYELDEVRSKVPMVYVEAIPVRLNADGSVALVGTLLRITEAGLQRSFVAGRVLYQETLREALVRHLEKDLGTMALPRLAPSLVPFAVNEYYPTPGFGLHDARQHAVALAYVVVIDGDVEPCDDALDFSWFTPEQASDPMLHLDMESGHGVLLRRLLVEAGYPA